MTNITPILTQEAGIQYQGVEDRSSKTGTYPIIGMITGTFKRGRYDKPMTITLENIKAQLGHEPDNPHYIAVLDVLMSGVPSVQVLRTKGGGNLICVNVPKFEHNSYIVTYYTAEDRDFSQSELDQIYNQILESLTVTINGQTYTSSETRAINVRYRAEYGCIELGIDENIVGPHESLTVCAALPIRVYAPLA